jgi:hypothetical protein
MFRLNASIMSAKLGAYERMLRVMPTTPSQTAWDTSVCKTRLLGVWIRICAPGEQLND